jgi:hypothetical protein
MSVRRVGRRALRPLYWGLIFTLAGVFSSIILQIITGCEHMPTTFKPMILNVAKVLLHYGKIFTIYVALSCIARFMMFFSLPLAISIEAWRSRVRLNMIKRKHGRD